MGAGSVVAKGIPLESIAAGNPCRVACSRKEFFQKQKQYIVSHKAPFAEIEQDKLIVNQKNNIRKFLDFGMGYVR